MVRLTVPGKADLGVNIGKLRSTRVSGGYRFDVDVRNTGNVLFTMSGSVELRRAESSADWALSPMACT